MLANPVAIDFDEKGRLFVSETYRYRSSVLDIRDYMGMLELDLAARTIDDRLKLHRTVFGEAAAKQLGIEGEVVRLVEDKDGDGVADASRVFSDGYNNELDGIASGVLARHGKVWFTNIPSLWLLEEQRRRQGEEERAAARLRRALQLHGPRFPRSRARPRRQDLLHHRRPRHAREGQGRPARGCTRMKARCSAPTRMARSSSSFAHGLRNPQELAFDEHGNLFTGDNDSDQGDQERLVYLVRRWRQRLARGLPACAHGQRWPVDARRPVEAVLRRPPGLSTAAGLQHRGRSVRPHVLPGHRPHVRIRQAFLHHSFQGQHRPQRHPDVHLEQDGASFKPTSSQQFMGGVLPTDVTFGPDGVLYSPTGWMAGRRARRAASTASRPANEERPSARRSAPKSPGCWPKAHRARAMPNSAALLAHADRRVRLDAQLELASRGDKSIGGLHQGGQQQEGRASWRDCTRSGASRSWAGRTPRWRHAGRSYSRTRRPKCVRRPPRASATSSSPRRAPQASTGRVDATPSARVRFFAAQSLGKVGDQNSGAAAAGPAQGQRQPGRVHPSRGSLCAVASIKDTARARSRRAQGHPPPCAWARCWRIAISADAERRAAPQRLRRRTSRVKPPAPSTTSPSPALTPRWPRSSDSAPVGRSRAWNARHQCALPARRGGQGCQGAGAVRHARRGHRGHARRSAACSWASGARRRSAIAWWASIARCRRATRKPAADALSAVLTKVLGTRRKPCSSRRSMPSPVSQLRERHAHAAGDGSQ